MASANVVLSVGAWIAAVIISCCCVDFFADKPKPSEVCLESEGVLKTEIPRTNYYRGQIRNLVANRVSSCQQNNPDKSSRWREKNCPEKKFYGLACRTAFKVEAAMDTCNNALVKYYSAGSCAQLGQCTWEAYEYDEPKAAQNVIEKITDCCKQVVSEAEEKAKAKS